ncbi:hypothetical protein HMPREF1119_1852 [Haemophilus parainfluenzae HK2019]|uniref:Uncharacterized protein n=1 Tax=Haemophilus parainfluenzae HK2019 TaxID=1095746 RepID=A0ABP2NVN7_HAEPA|nr:hypothetical protein HMPREF1119_1852 [Haemophilus parainfluenzae HK2019]
MDQPCDFLIFDDKSAVKNTLIFDRTLNQDYFNRSKIF